VKVGARSDGTWLFPVNLFIEQVKASPIANSRAELELCARAPASGAIRAVKVRLREKFTPR
jgi:hypothetical protein